MEAECPKPVPDGFLVEGTEFLGLEDWNGLRPAPEEGPDRAEGQFRALKPRPGEKRERSATPDAAVPVFGAPDLTRGTARTLKIFAKTDGAKLGANLRF